MYFSECSLTSTLHINFTAFTSLSLANSLDKTKHSLFFHGTQLQQLQQLLFVEVTLVLALEMDGACMSALVEPPMSPRSPPGGLDLYGKRRQLVKVQVLEREIGLLQEELKSIEEFHPASTCCKELEDFVKAKPDPLISINQENHKSNSLWKRFWGKLCSNPLWVCCSKSCLHQLQKDNCCTCYVSFNLPWPSCSCSKQITCQNSCKFKGSPCRHHSSCCCCCFKPCNSKCTKVNLCSDFAKCCANTCCP